MKTNVLLLTVVFLLIGLYREIQGQQNSALQFQVETYDGLILPAQVLNPGPDKKIILFINGSTPYDEKGNLGAVWNDEGKILKQRHDFYLRFLEIMTHKGYAVATMAKRSFVYPTKLPRPGLNDLALDIVYFTEALKREGVLSGEKSLIIAGYSEGSIVASKVLGMLKNRPYACILMGSATSELDCSNIKVENYPKADVLRRWRNFTDEQIEAEFNQYCLIHQDLSEMEEAEFEDVYKKSRPHGLGFAMWESLRILQEITKYDPVADLSLSGVPLLMCVGDNDLAMPEASAQNVYERLKATGADITLKVIEDDVHQYRKYDLFPIIVTWLTTNFSSVDYELNQADSILIDKYTRLNDLITEISAVPFGGGFPDKILDCYHKAPEAGLTDPVIWFFLGIKLFTDDFPDEAFNSFNKVIENPSALDFAAYVWMGHIKDLNNSRNDAVEMYQKALDVYPGFPMNLSNWNMLIDKSWIEERIQVPFKGLEN
jgi:predicted esterase